MSLLALALLLLVTAGCGTERSRVPSRAGVESPDQQVDDFVIFGTDQGTMQWTLHASHAATYNARNVTVARDIRVDFFDERGAQSSELTAREGEIQLMTSDMTARGNVILQTSEGTRMSTDEIRFLNREQRIVSSLDQLVRVESKSGTLTGYGFESDPDLKDYKFQRITLHMRSNGGVSDRKGVAR